MRGVIDPVSQGGPSLSVCFEKSMSGFAAGGNTASISSDWVKTYKARLRKGTNISKQLIQCRLTYGTLD